MRVKINSLYIRNFKGIRELTIQFGDSITEISGKNATGKTSVYDAFQWLFFNTSSSGDTDKGLNSFSRPRSADGSVVDNIEIEVSASLDIDGKATELRKVQKQKWQRIRGTDQTVLKGNENSFEINGVGKKQADFDEFINSIADKEHIKLITDIFYFESLPESDMKSGTKITKGRRSYLLDVAGDVTAADIIADDPEKWGPVRNELLSFEYKDALTKVKADRANLDKQRKELPIRADELSRQISDVPNTSAQAEKMERLKAEIAELDKRIAAISADAERSKLESRKADIQRNMSNIKAEAEKVIRDKQYAAEQAYRNAKKSVNDCADEVERGRRTISQWETRLADLNARFKEAEARFNEAKSRVFPQEEKICPTCGQMLPEKKIAELMANFASKRNHDMAQCQADGTEILKLLNTANAEIQALKEKDSALQKKLNALKADLQKTESAWKQMQSEKADLSNNADYKKLETEYVSVIDAISKLPDSESEIALLTEEKRKVTAEIESLSRFIKSADMIKMQNDSCWARIADLEEEKKAIGQAMALAEQKVFLLEEFAVVQAKKLSDKINECFEVARFSLVDEYQSGGVSAGCKIVYGGIKENAINTGHRIKVLLDIVKTFQRHYGVTFPLFIDNAECLSSDNQPVMDCQLVLLKVTDDPELKVVAK